MAKDTKSIKQGTVKLVCDCINTFQDQTYGRGVRIHNLGNGTACCTGCAKKKSYNK